MCLLFPNTTIIAQDANMKSLLKSNDSLFDNIVKAHRIYKEIGEFNVNKNMKFKDTKSVAYKNAIKTKAVIEEQRSLVNSLMNNMNKMTPSQSLEAYKIIDDYIKKAKNLDTKKEQLNKTKIATVSSTFKQNEKKIAANLEDTTTIDSIPKSNGNKIRISTKNSLLLQLKFNPTIYENDCVVYLFPKWWIYDESLLGPLYNSDWTNITPCKKILNRYGFVWFKGKTKMWRKIPSGPFILITIDKVKNKVLDHTDIEIPYDSNIYETEISK